MRSRILLILLLVACASRATRPVVSVPVEWKYPLAAAEPVVADHGLVAADEPLAAETGAQILRQGGNAIDAAVAVAFALAVVYPEAGNLGGGGFAVVRLADGRAQALDFREMAPAAASRDMFLDAQGELTAKSREGHLASGVPGTVAGLWELHQRFGSRPWPALLEPAIRLAAEGFVVGPTLAQTVAEAAPRLGQAAATKALFLPGGKPLEPGSSWRNPDLADTLRRIAVEGPYGFYRGRTAELLIATMQEGGGIITAQDLQAYRPVWREPIAFTYRGYRVFSMPPPSSGGVTLATACAILEAFDLRSMGWHAPRHLHVMIEAFRRAYADRNTYLGDPDFTATPIQTILSPSRIEWYRSGIALDHKSPSSDFPAPLPARDPDHTTHFGVVDAAGNVVSLTTTINDLYGSAVTVAGAGFLLNNEMDDFTAKPGVPNMFGLVQGEANVIGPGKRPLSSMTPTIVLSREGRPLMVLGGRGGSRIISGVFQVLSNVIDFAMDADDAVRAPRIHHQHLPDTVVYEAGGLGEDVIRALEAMGHATQAREHASPMSVVPTMVKRGTTWTGAGDPRRTGAAVGW